MCAPSDGRQCDGSPGTPAYDQQQWPFSARGSHEYKAVQKTNETQKSEKTIDLAVVVTPGNMDLYTIPEQYLKYIPTT